MITSSVEVYDWRTASEFPLLSEIDLLIPEAIFSIRCSECRVCFHCNGTLTNWSIVENVSLNEPALSGRDDKRLCQSLHLVVLHGSTCNHVHYFPVMVMIIFESITTNVKRTINKSKTKFGLVTNDVKLKSGSD